MLVSVFSASLEQPMLAPPRTTMQAVRPSSKGEAYHGRIVLELITSFPQGATSTAPPGPSSKSASASSAPAYPPSARYSTSPWSPPAPPPARVPATSRDTPCPYPISPSRAGRIVRTPIPWKPMTTRDRLHVWMRSRLLMLMLKAVVAAGNLRSRCQGRTSRVTPRIDDRVCEYYLFWSYDRSMHGWLRDI